MDVLSNDSVDIAKRLLGCELVRTLPGGEVRVRIVETELYRQDDEASHSFRGSTPRTQVMFEHFGFAYVYFTYGMHYCFNIVVGTKGKGAAVLIRAVEPITGSELMALNRPVAIYGGPNLSNGPAKLCQALAIDLQLNRHPLDEAPLQLILKKPVPEKDIVTTTRIGISKAKAKPWRFYIRDNPYISKL